MSLSSRGLGLWVSARADARVVGYLAVSVAAVLYGLWANLSKLAEASVPPLTIALYTQFLPGLLYVPAVARHGFPRRDVPLLVLVSLAGAVAAPVVYYFGLVGTTASNAALLSNSEAVFTVVIAFGFLGERLRARGYIAMAGVVIGAFVVTTELRVTDLASVQYLGGNLLLILGTFFWAVDNNGSTILSKRSRILPMISVKLLLGSALLLPIILVTGAPLIPTGPDAWLLLVIAFGGVASFTILFYHALRRIGAMRAGSILSTSSLWGVLFSLVLFPNVGLSAVQIAGGALMVVSTIALYVLGSSQESSAAPGETLKPAGSDGPRSP